MTIKQATKELKRYNKWRRGADIKVSEPKTIGIAIDTVVEWLEKELKNKRTWQRQKKEKKKLRILI